MSAKPLPADLRERVVLDTNVCLDLLLFRDPRAAALLTALQTGRVVACTNDQCRDEWLRVLHYPQLRLTDQARAELRLQFDALMVLLSQPAHRDAPSLPRCADLDDQKFLELAQAVGARWLISRDSDVLALDARAKHAGLFEIMTPLAWSLRSGG